MGALIMAVAVFVLGWIKALVFGAIGFGSAV